MSYESLQPIFASHSLLPGHKLSLTNHQFTQKFSNRNFWVEQEEAQRRQKVYKQWCGIRSLFSGLLASNSFKAFLVHTIFHLQVLEIEKYTLSKYKINRCTIWVLSIFCVYEANFVICLIHWAIYTNGPWGEELILINWTYRLSIK